MKIKQIRNIVLLSSLVVFTACVDQNNINVQKEKEMREKATIDISKMPLQTYEAYIKLKRFVLEKYIPVESKSATGIGYLADGTKIKYYFDSKNVAETITHKKRPFREVQKTYHVDSKSIKYFIETIASLDIGKTIIYNYFGEVQKVFDEDSELRKKGLDYKKLLEGAEKQGFIDLKEGKMLKGDSFKIYIEEDSKAMTREAKEKFAKKVSLSYTIIDNFIEDKYSWRFDIEYKDRTEMYSFTRDGVFVTHLMTSRRVRY